MIIFTNDIEIKGDVAVLHIVRQNGDKYDGLIDTEDLHRLIELDSTWTVTFNRNKQHVYLIANIRDSSKKCGYTTIRLQRFLTNCPCDMVVDHINHNTLDNRKENLRIVKPSINSKNRNSHNNNNSTGVRNVSYNKSYKKSPYQVQLQINGKNTVVGRFKTLEEASVFAEYKRDGLYGEYTDDN